MAGPSWTLPRAFPGAEAPNPLFLQRSAALSLLLICLNRRDIFYLVPWVMQWFEKKSGIGLVRGRHFLDQKKVAKD